MRAVTFLIFDQFDALDVVGPYDVLSMANIVMGRIEFALQIVAERTMSVPAIGGLLIEPHLGIDSIPAEHQVIIVPGGPPTKRGNRFLKSFMIGGELLREGNYACYVECLVALLVDRSLDCQSGNRGNQRRNLCQWS
jgi:hypothetical protein